MSEHEERRERMRESLRLQVKIDRMQAAGDALAEEWERELKRLKSMRIDGAYSQIAVGERIERLTKKLAAWTQAKEMT